MAKRTLCFFSILLTVFLSLAVWGTNAMGMKRTYTFSTRNDVLVNPYIGYAVMAQREDYAALTDLVYIEVTWKELEPAEGVFDWNAIYEKNHIAMWKSLGKHAVFRFICDNPTKENHMDIPEWLYTKTAGDGTVYDIDYGKGYSPNYANETFLACHKKVMEEIGKTLGADDFVSYVELGSLGHWGEWHVYYPAGIDRIPKTEIRKQYVDAYKKAFPNAKLLMRRPFKELPEDAGVYNDMTGDMDSTKEFLNWIQNGGSFSQAEEKDGLKAVPSLWEHAPVGGEFTSGTPMDQMLSVDYEKTVSLLKESHMTFVGPKTPGLDASKNPYYQKGLSLLQYIGYRYTVPSVETRRNLLQGSVEISLQLKNIGTAPTYWDFIPYLYVETKDGTFKKYRFDADLKTLTSGNSLLLQQTIPWKQLKGKSVFFGMVNAANENESIKLDLHTDSLGGMYYLFSMN